MGVGGGWPIQNKTALGPQSKARLPGSGQKGYSFELEPSPEALILSFPGSKLTAKLSVRVTK